MSLQREVDKILRDIENPDGGNLFVVFDERPCYNEEESKRQGRPIFEPRVYITKHKDALSVNISRALPEDIAAYPRQYDDFIKRKTEREAGIPIGMLPAITPTQTATCEACGVYTIESLASADERVMAILRQPELKKRAIEYLGKTDRMAELEAEIVELKKKLGGINEPVDNMPKRRGRKPAIREADSDNQQ